MTKKAQLPDGTILEFPAGTPDSVIDATVKRELNVAPKTTDSSSARGFGLGFREPFDIIFSKLENIQAPDIINTLGPSTGIPIAAGLQNIRNLGNVLGLPTATNVLSETDKLRAENDAKIAQLFGNIGGTISALPFRPVAAPATLLEAAGGGALTSAALSRAANTPDFLSDVAAGTIFGTALKPVADIGANVIAPQASNALKYLVANKVYPTLGMITSQAEGLLPKFVSGIEEGITSLPGVGDIVSLARESSVKEFGRSLANKAAKYVNATVPKNLSGEQAVGWVKNKLSEGYKALVPNLDFEVKSDFLNDASKIYNNLNIPSSRSSLNDDWLAVLKDNIFGVMDSAGKITGDNLQNVLSNLGDTANQLMKSTDGFERRLGTGVSQLRKAWFDALAKQNPKQAADLKRLNAGYSITSQLQKATSGVGGEITPASLERAVTAFSGGGARRGPLASDVRAGRMLPSRTADSGTFRRAVIGTGATAGLAEIGNQTLQYYGFEGATPAQKAAVALIAAPYTPVGRAAIAKIMGRTPSQFARGAANVFRLGISPATSSATIKPR